MKWIVEEDGTPEALELRARAKLSAPDLLLAECTNILWKKVRNRNLTIEAALLGARLLERSDIELLSARPLLEEATRIAIELDHPAYDCVYIALAVANSSRFVTADERLLRNSCETGERT
ncbi:MAG: type II toxin-antitoxin system VapC family toxin [Deltaproteobacteria bacterium]|nr:type II toxin-antitoxin system VapC family toxin [Deltaproteobacteria bacterium]